MIIISQEKDASLNFDNIVAIRLSEDLETNKRNIIAIDTINAERYYIAKYATEERAKEVLQEIKDAYCCTKILKFLKVGYKETISGENMAKTIAYEMPEE